MFGLSALWKFLILFIILIGLFLFLTGKIPWVGATSILISIILTLIFMLFKK